MTIVSYIKSFSKIELSLLIVFILYILFPVKTPVPIAPYIDSPLGITSILFVTVYLFFYTKPVLGVIYLLVAYELLRRSTQNSSRVPLIEWVPSQPIKDIQMASMNVPQSTTLEEEIVGQRGPIDESRPIMYESTGFKPVAENVNGASLI